MNLKYFTEPFLAQLKRAIPHNLPRYSTPNSWIDNYASGSTYCRDTGIEITTLRPLLPCQGENLNDIENTQIIYTDLKSLTPVQATDERLWAYLAHVTYWEYMLGRWGNLSKSSVIEDRFFFKSGGIGTLVRNRVLQDCGGLVI